MSDQILSKIAVFKGKKVRKVIYNNEWWFVVNDVIETLTDSNDPAQYFKRLKMRDQELTKLIDQGGGYNLYHPLCSRWKQRAEIRKCTAGTRKAFSG